MVCWVWKLINLSFHTPANPLSPGRRVNQFVPPPLEVKIFSGASCDTPSSYNVILKFSRQLAVKSYCLQEYEHLPLNFLVIFLLLGGEVGFLSINAKGFGTKSANVKKGYQYQHWDPLCIFFSVDSVGQCKWNECIKAFFGSVFAAVLLLLGSVGLASMINMFRFDRNSVKQVDLFLEDQLLDRPS